MNARIQFNRDRLLKSGHVQCVQREEFIALLTSRRPLEREDDDSSGMCVLRDQHSGIRYLLPQEHLSAAH
ncbi:MAG: hypothetical protein Fues2KO_27680 [Fuerstiella sp.]